MRRIVVLRTCLRPVIAAAASLILSVATPALAAEIHDAARSGNVERVAALVKADNTQVKATDEHGATPLHLAKNEAVAKVLINAAAPLGAKDDKGRTPVDAAVADGRVDVAAAIIDNLAKTMEAVKNLGSAMLGADAAAKAIQAKDLPRLTAVIDNNPNVVKEVTVKQKLTPLFFAVDEKWIPGIDLLIERGADMEALDPEFGGTALHEAASGYHTEVVGALLDHGAKIDARAGKDRLTPLMLAVTGNDYEMVVYLLLRGADAGIKSAGGTSVYDVARSKDKDRDDILFVLTQHKTLGPKGFVAARNLLKASYTGDVAEIQATAGADKKLLDVRNNTLGLAPLHLAAEGGKPEAASVLIGLGADPLVKTAAGRTPFELAADDATKAVFRKAGAYTAADVEVLLRAAAHGDIAKMTELLDSCPKMIDAQNKFLGTALHWAADAGNVESVKFLLARGANTKLKDDMDRTAKETAKKRKHPEVVKLF